MLRCPYEEYYVSQAGGGLLNVYSGSASQKGHGLGSLFGSLMRWITPLLKKGAIALGHRAVDMGGKVLHDVTAGEKLGTSFKKRAKEQLGQGVDIKRRTLTCNVIRKPQVKRARTKRDPDTLD